MVPFKLKILSVLLISLAVIAFSSACNETKKLSEFDYTEEEAQQYEENQDREVDTSVPPVLDEAYFSENEIRMEDYRYVENIRTDQLFRKNDPLSLPIISLTNGPALELHFDDLSSEREDYYYRVYHCNSDWTRSDLLDTEYIQGFFSNVITDYEFSFGTLVQYVHYRAEFPNRNMLLTKSGNYVVVVMKDDDESQVVLTRRFMVADERVAIVPNVRQTAVVQERDHKQLVDFEVHHASFDIDNPFRDIKTVILQNGRWDNAKTALTPIFLRDRMLEYRYETGNDFWGGNQYRRFNISSVRYASDQIRNITRLEDRWFVNLTLDRKRNLTSFSTLQDAHGRYLIKTDDGYDDRTEGDYLDVHFELALSSPLRTGSVYVFGGLTNFKADKAYQMHYSQEMQAYELTILLKQGYYEYQYMVLSDYSEELDPLPIEGSHYETDNEYTILIYYRDIRNDYDELIGSRTFNALDFF